MEDGGGGYPAGGPRRSQSPDTGLVGAITGTPCRQSCPHTCPQPPLQQVPVVQALKPTSVRVFLCHSLQDSNKNIGAVLGGWVSELVPAQQSGVSPAGSFSPWA